MKAWVDDNLSAIAAYVYLEEQHQTGNREVQTANRTHQTLRRSETAGLSAAHVEAREVVRNRFVDWSQNACGEVLEHE